MTSGFASILYICTGTLALWTGIMFINGTLFVEKMSSLYETISSPLWRMIVILPVLGIGHLFFSLALKANPVVASPAGIVFTVIPPAIYALWLLGVLPNVKVTLLVVGLIILAVLLGVELAKISH